MVQNIDLFKVFETPNLRDRDSVSEIFKQFSDKEVILDFENIEFISKSFANELKKRIKNSSTKVRLVNKNKSIQKMLKVANYKPSFKNEKIKEISISS